MGSSEEEELYMEDLKALTSQVKKHESLIRLKRRWLMNLSLSKAEKKRIEKVLPGSDKMLPESYIREDDPGYEEIWTHIETGYGINNHGKEHSFAEEDFRICISRNDFQGIFFLLDDMTCKGLCSFIRLLTGRTIIIDKMNDRTKMIIKESLSKIISDNSDASRKKFKKLCQLLKEKDPKKIHRNKVANLTAYEAYHAIASVMDALQEFPIRTLRAMYRKLRGITGYVPSVQPQKFREVRSELICQVRKLIMNMQSDLGENGEPSRPLADALGVAGLTLKLMNRPTIMDFRKLSSDTKAFQDNILEAIHRLNDSNRGSLAKLKQVQFLLDPTSQLSVRSLRIAVRNFLTEYLFECDDMNMPPSLLVETVAIINRGSQLPYEACIPPHESVMEVIQKEVDCVLTISAQARDVVLNLLPELEFDEDFAQAYMENFKGNDTFHDTDDEEGQSGDILQHSYGQLESVGETDATVSNSHLSMRNGEDSYLTPPSNGRSFIFKTESVEVSGSLSQKELYVTPKQHILGSVAELGHSNSDFFKATAENKLSSLSPCPDIMSIENDVKTKENRSCASVTPKHEVYDNPMEDASIVSRQRECTNQYLEVQKACDNTSMAAYNFADLILDRLANSEDLEILQDILPSSSSDPEHSGGSPNSFFASKFAEFLNDVCQRNPAITSLKSSGGRSKKFRTA